MSQAKNRKLSSLVTNSVSDTSPML